MTGTRGSIGFASTYRPPLPLDIFWCPATMPLSKQDELHMSDGKSYNCNGREIPSAALKTILNRPVFTATSYTGAEVDSGHLSGLIHVSERDNGLETLNITLRLLNDDGSSTCEVFDMAAVFGSEHFKGVRMEDSGSVAGDYLVYVTTKDPATTKDGAAARRQPWTAVYKTHLTTGETTRLTPFDQADLSPSMHPSGTKIAVASFEGKAGGWGGEIEDLKTNIFVMNLEPPFDRNMVVENGGWPSWGSDNVLFFHKKVYKNWVVYRAENIGGGSGPVTISGVTPDGIDAMTPAAIDATTVAVATIRQKSGFSDERVEGQHRHIEMFRYPSKEPLIKITKQIRPLADHFNPFVISGETKRIGYHRGKTDHDDLESSADTQNHSNKLASPDPDVDVFRVPGIFPTFSKDGTKMAFVDNEFKNIWLVDSKGLRKVYRNNIAGNIFSPVWNQDTDKDTLYALSGPAFNAKASLNIIAIKNVSKGTGYGQSVKNLTKDYNNAFPSTNPQGTKLVFRSTRDGHKNLYIMNNLKKGDYDKASVKRLTDGPWTDTHCQWSPKGDWIVFSSSRDKPPHITESDNGLDPGYFAVFLVKADDPTVCVRVLGSESNNVAGHVNHPFFSPDMRSIVVASDLAAVSAEPISLPLFVHSVRPYGDIFTIDIDPDDIQKNENVGNFRRITHSRYENSTATWTNFSTQDQSTGWNQLFSEAFKPLCPHLHDTTRGETFYMTGHLCIPRRCC